jgi:hypothetical protein
MEVVMDNDGRMALDYIKIEQTLARYARSIDRMDRDLILSVYWEDAHDSHGVFEGGPVEFADWVGAYLGRFKAFSHFLGQSSIDLQGDHADCETYFTTYKHDAQDSGDVMSLVGGRYHDWFERRNGEWRIRRRELLLDWAYDVPIEDALLQLPLLRPQESIGRRSREDRSYHSLRQGALAG